jgi:hypothetical protein
MSGALIWAGLAMLAVFGGAAVRRRLDASVDDNEASLDDDAIRRIIETGALSLDQDPPLDLEEIEEEEDRFWSESWDEPEEW